MLFLCCFLTFSQEDKTDLKKSRLRNNESVSESALMLLEISELYLKQEVFDSCIVYAKKVFELSDKKRDITYANVYYGRANIAIGNYELGKNALEKTINYLKENNDEKLPTVYSTLGGAYINLNVLDKALINLKEAEKTITAEEDRATVYIYFAIFYSNTRQYERAIDYLNKVTSLSLRYGDKRRLASAYAYFAKLNTDRREFQESINYYFLAEELFKNLKSDINVASIQNNIAENYAAIDSVHLARDYYNKALLISEKNNYKQLKTIVSSNIAKQDILEGINLNESINELQIINGDNYPIKIKGLICENYYYLTLGYLKKKDTLRALKLLKKGIKISEEENFYSLREKSTSLLATLNYNGKNYKQAYLNAKEVIAYKEELYNKEKNEEIELLRTKFDVNKKETDLKNKEQELLFITEKQNKKNQFYILFGLLLFTIILLLYRQIKLVKSRRQILVTENELLSLKEERLQVKIQSKENELTNLAIDIDEKNKFLENLKLNIKRIKNNTNSPLVNEELQSILFNANESIKRTQDKIQILLDVDKTNKNFYDKLKLNYPSLTEKEIKTISYLRISMSSKQISEALNISELSVNNLRSKIRKKLKLEKKDNLVEFIKNI